MAIIAFFFGSLPPEYFSTTCVVNVLPKTNLRMLLLLYRHSTPEVERGGASRVLIESVFDTCTQYEYACI